MSKYDAMKAAMYSELQKISGEMQGFTRMGRKPISVEKMLENEEDSPTPSEAFAIEKTSGEGMGAAKAVGALGLGAGLYHLATKANEDRKRGLSFRLQQSGY